MNTNTDTPYTRSAYRSDSHEPMPLPKRHAHLNRNGLFDTQIAFGNYAGLDPAMEITLQLECEEHRVYQQQEERGEKQEVYCDARRWRFQNSSKIPHILFVSQIMCFFFIWAAWGAGVTPYLEPEPTSTSIVFSVFNGLIIAALMLISTTLYMTEKKEVHYLQLSGLLICATIVLWLKGTLW
ncbi:hypothetical protein ACIPY9_24105, partial [Pseudomonas sp. NPDC089734]